MSVIGETIRRKELWEIRQRKAHQRHQTMQAVEFYFLLVLGYALFMYRDRVGMLLGW